MNYMQETCEDAALTAEARLARLGQLMDASHASCRDLYDCSHADLDRLVERCRSAGALGSRLTGAGWGGCCVSLVPVGRIDHFVAEVQGRYYTSEYLAQAHKRGQTVGDLSTIIFVTRPGSGVAYLTCPGGPNCT